MFSLRYDSVCLFHFTSKHLQKQGSCHVAYPPEFERMATFGSLAPDLWMKNATGAPVGPAALLAATRRALER
jgi:hypothetical protein